MKSEAIHNLGLAFHELATNATKYGALSISGGRVGISWQIVSEGEEPVCRLVWRETGGPRVRKPSRNGFGRYVTGTLVARALGGKVSSDFAAAGFVWQFDIPMTNFSEENFPPTPHASEPPVAAPA